MTPVLVSCRLPFDPAEPGHAAGGVTRCLLGHARARGARWIGLATGSASWTAGRDGVTFDGVGVKRRTRSDALDGFANSTLWPLFHGSPRPPALVESWWAPFVALNAAVARRAAEVAPVGGVVWVHDYQLMLVPRLLAERRPDVTIRFFLHIPFPSPEELAVLPWAAELLEGVRASTVVGVQDAASATHLRHALALLTPSVAGRRIPSVEVHPVPAEAREVATLARSPGVRRAARELRARLGSPRTLLVGIDRLDYTKGVDLRLLAFEHLLLCGRLDPSTARLLQVSPPCRLDAAHYGQEQARVRHLVERINDRHATGGPVVVLEERTFGRDETVAAMVAADVMLVTSRRDGMNLVAKEYVAARERGDGALVLSRAAGAAHQLVSAHLVEPTVEDIGRGIAAAQRAGHPEQRRRMRAMRGVVLGEDPLSWAEACLGTAALEAAS